MFTGNLVSKFLDNNQSVFAAHQNELLFFQLIFFLKKLVEKSSNCWLENNENQFYVIDYSKLYRY